MSSTKVRFHAIVSVVAAGLIALSGCSGSANSGADKTMAPSAKASQDVSSSSSDTAVFPMDFKNADGSMTKIPAKPKRIVSTSVTLTGMAMPFKAPIVASSTAANADFFPAWKKDAEAMNVKKLWKAQTAANLEAVTAAKPDLILVSSLGADSVRDQVKDLQKIAPTVVIDYSKIPWQQVTTSLGKITGMEKEANEVVENYNKEVKDLAGKLKHPEGEVNIISYNGNAKPNAIAQTGGPYGQLFTELGFKVEQPKKEWDTRGTEGGHRTDFVFTSLEHLTELKGQTTFLILADEKRAEQMMSDPVLANVPSVKAKQVYPLGKKVFRLDYYTSKIVMKAVSGLYAK